MRSPSGCLAVLASLAPASAQDLIVAPDGLDRDRLGQALALDHDLIVAGAPGDDDLGQDSGSVYVFREGVSGYFLEQRFVAPDGAPGDAFGQAVDVEDDRVVVGAYFHAASDQTRAGAVYLFRRLGAGWAFEAKIEAFDASQGARFGRSVSLSGDTLAVGAYQDGQFDTKAGAVYVYRLVGTSWTLEAKLAASDGMERDQFGNDVSLHGDRLAVGAVLAEGLELDTGAAYVYARSGAIWTEEAKLVAPDGAYFHRFGASVCLDGDRVAVGAPIHDGARGAAYVFARSGTSWALEGRVEALDRTSKQRFGFDVVLAGTTLYVGAPFRALQRGAVYSFERVGTAWTPRGKHAPPVVGVGNQFGTSVAADGARIVGGAPQIAAGRGAVVAIDEQPLTALCPPQAGRLIAADGAPNVAFGASLAADGGFLAVGAPASASAQRSGGVHVFERMGSSWTLGQRLQAVTPLSNDEFGTRVALCGDLLSIGSEAGLGDVYFFRRMGSAWSLQQRMRNLISSGISVRGAALAVDGDRLAVGGAVDLIAGERFVFVVNHGSGSFQMEEVLQDDLSFGFGRALALRDPYLFASTAPNQARVYLRSGTGWSPVQTLGAPASASILSALDDELFWGSPLFGGSMTGRVFVFRRQGTVWSLAQTLQPNDPQAAARFGEDLDVAGDRLAVAAPGARRVYVFTRRNGAWTEVGSTADRSSFGDAVALLDDVMVVSSTRDDPSGASSGSVALYEPGLYPATYCTGKTSSLGCVPFASTAGLPSAASTQPFQVLANDLIPGQAGFLLYGTDRAGIPFHGATLCVKGVVRRLLPAKAATATGPPPCAGVLRVDFGQHVASGVDPLLTVGRRVTAQWYQRDALDPAGFGDGLSDAVTFALCP